MGEIGIGVLFFGFEALDILQRIQSVHHPVAEGGILAGIADIIGRVEKDIPYFHVRELGLFGLDESGHSHHVRAGHGRTGVPVVAGAGAAERVLKDLVRVAVPVVIAGVTAGRGDVDGGTVVGIRRQSVIARSGTHGNGVGVGCWIVRLVRV